MPEEFPKIQKGQVTLSRANVDTGIILDELNNYALSPSQKVYTVFGNESDALNAARLLVEANPHIECYIHQASKKLLYFLDSKGMKHF